MIDSKIVGAAFVSFAASEFSFLSVLETVVSIFLSSFKLFSILIDLSSLEAS